ncbi:thiamine pyrophosphate-dependent dehydrogenase E1 component subunit alpha [Anaerofustis sp.]|uniref:thiamine pyrophosphate-dependent dehydrogenase E1 component subunit alpha n=1 Tax=Anaerofustis sp. TaxID=1872517 RepID=UPI0025C68D95|nr:thiamine pyrophosphate-dependent dehydrogenase E1 component subunit alpha [Anaerofustis sp.]
MNINNQKIVELFYKMLKVRVFEEKLASLYEDGKIHTELYLSIGQEAVSAGAMAAINGKDKVFTSHRNFAASICLEMDVEKMFREIMGLDGGYTNGIAGPGYMADIKSDIYGASALPAGNVSVATGVAMGEKIHHTNNIVVSFIGDGAVNEGVFSESVNMASMFKLPIIYLVENNGYAKGQSFAKTSTVKDIASRAGSFSIPGIIVDGNNVLDVYEAMLTAASYVRGGKGPIILEAKTYRFSGHHLEDKALYRSSKELKSWFEKCPIKILSNYMLQNMVGIDDDLQMMKDTISNEMDSIINKILNEKQVPKEIQEEKEEEKISKKTQIEEELKSLLEQKEFLKHADTSVLIEEPKLKIPLTTSEDLKDTEEDIRANDKVFDEIRKLKNIFPERDDIEKEEIKVEDILKNGHTHKLISNTDGFADVDFSDSLKRKSREAEDEDIVTEEEKKYISNAQTVLDNIFKEIDEEEKKYKPDTEGSFDYINFISDDENKDDKEITYVSSSNERHADFNRLKTQNIDQAENKNDGLYVNEREDVLSNLDVDDEIINEYMRKVNDSVNKPFTVIDRNPSQVIDVSDNNNGNDISDLHSMLKIDNQDKGSGNDYDFFGEADR